MKVLIVEDEPIASQKLISMLSAIDGSIEILAILESVKKVKKWLEQNEPPQLAFLDIQLADDTSFEIFKHHAISFPVIFTTAYDEHILQSLEYNTIDYLLKPIAKARLIKALEKVKNLENHFFKQRFDNFLRENSQLKAPYKTRYVVKKGIDFVAVNVNEVAYFFTEHKIVFLKDINDTKYIIDKTLTELSDELDPKVFFRANRKFIVHIEAIKKFKSVQGKIVLEVTPTAEGVAVSKENAPNFRNWISG